jgi:UDP-glucose 4-epimerase/UDP-glucuronate decarboxylase
VAERVLITGGAGFIGLHLARRLVHEGKHVMLLDDYSRGRVDEEFRRVSEHADVVEHDLTRPIPKGLLGAVDTVYHLAAAVGVRQATERPDYVLRTNMLSTLHLLDWCRRNPPRAMFLSSTSEVADGAIRMGLSTLPSSEEVPFVLATPRSPRSSYALSKMVSESLLLYSADAFPIRIGRYHNVYGPRMGAAHVIPQFIERLHGGEQPFVIYGAQQSRAFCYVDDAVAATIALTRLEAPEPIVVNIGNDTEEIRAIDLAERLFDLAGRHPEVLMVDPPPGSPERRRPELTRLRRLVDFRPDVSLDAGLKATFDWYTTHRQADDGCAR